MKKTVLAFVMGIALSISVTAFAEEVQSLIGRTIEGQFPVKVNGEQLSVQAIVIDGTSYLPVRAVGEALNLEIKFDSDLGIELNDKDDEMMETMFTTEMSEEDKTAIETAESQIIAAQKRIDDALARIAEAEQNIIEIQKKIEKEKDQFTLMLLKAELESAQNIIDSANETIEMNQTGINQLQDYIDEIKVKYETAQ